MKKIQIFTLAAALVWGLTGCSEETGGRAPSSGSDHAVAYLSIRVEQRQHARGSSEEPGSATESELKSLCLVTFDAGGRVLNIPGGSAYYIPITSGDLDTPAGVKVSAAAKKLVVIANPGPKLITRLNTLTSGSTLSTLIDAIGQITVTEINGAGGFTMITGGDAKNKTPLAIDGTATDANRIVDPYVDIADKVQLITGSEDDARAEAEKPKNRVAVKLERLAAKLAVTEVPAGLAKPDGSAFTFLDWTVDAVNTTYYPFAEKTLTDGTHAAGDYVNHFYTKDPNFDEVAPPAYHAGLAYGFADPANNYEPQLPWNDHYGWKAQGVAHIAYVTENTMAAAAQRFGNATRLVIRATYYPPGLTPSGDWFAWSGHTYTFATLQAKYALNDDAALNAACDGFYDKVKAFKPGISGGDFASLTQADLDVIPNGGDVVKDGADPVIRWYQNGRNYYYYEIRHDNEKDGTMLFSKYGVVRNNSYRLTLESVSGAGTPWYPDLVNPGDGDPDPQEPIDQEAGYLGISVETAPWILWQTGMHI